MNLTGNVSKRWAQGLSQLFTAMAVLVVLLAGSGCTSAQNVRKARPMPVDAPEKVEIVASEAPTASEAGAEVAEDSSATPSQEEKVISAEAEILAAVTSGENGVAEALQQTRGAVFASLTTPAGAGPPASVVRTSEVGSTGDGLQDSVTQLTGDVEAFVGSAGVEPGGAAANEDPPQETEPAIDNETAQEEAESSIAESSPSPEPIVPQEAVESPAVEVIRVAPPPEPEPAPVSEELINRGLTTQDPAGAGVEGGTQSNTASVLFLILGGVGAALILLRKRVAA